MLEPRNQRDDRFLDIAGQAGGDAVAVILQRVSALGLEEDLVCLAIGETHDLVLDGRAVPGPRRLDLSRIHRGPMQVVPDDVVNGRIGVRDVAIDLALGNPIGEKRERHGVGIAGLRFQPLEIDGASVEPRRRSRLESTELEAEVKKAAREPGRGHVATPAAGRLDLSGVHQGLEERPRGQHDRSGTVLDATPATHAG